MSSNLLLAYPASAAFNITLGSLATTSTGGRQSDAVSNAVNKYLDYMIGGKIKAGTSPSAGVIEVWAYAAVNDTPTYPDVLTGADGNVTFTSRDILVSSMRLIASLVTDTTTGRVYWWAPVSLSSLFGGFCPFNFGVFVSNQTGVVLDSNSANSAIYYKPVYMTNG